MSDCKKWVVVGKGMYQAQYCECESCEIKRQANELFWQRFDEKYKKFKKKQGSKAE